MNPRTINYLSTLFITAVLLLSGGYFYKTWQNGEPRWYFLFLAFGIALMLSYNLFRKRK
ncbi:MAG: hypothetical protein ACI83W_000069 [Marinoscillum sp.]|jgi:hypothetical protein